MVHHWLRQPRAVGAYGRTPLQLIPLLLVLALAVACGAAATATPAPAATKAPAAAAPIATKAPVAAAPAATKAPVAAAPTATPVPAAKPTPAPAPATVLTQKRLHLAITPLPQDSFLPWLVTLDGHVLTSPMWENLTTIDPRTGLNVILPELATKWEISKDAKNFSFTLRKGVPFHFGKGEFTVKDFINGVDQNMQSASITGCRGTMIASMGAKSATEMQEKGNLKVIDDYTFTMQLAQPLVDLATWWFNTQGRRCAPIYSSAQFKAQGEAMFEKGPAGTGPYQFVRRTLKEFTEYERVSDKHWRVNPEFKTLRITTAPEEATRLAMLLTKEADMVDIAKVLHDQATNAGMVILESEFPAVGLAIMPLGQYYVSKVNWKPDQTPWAAPGEKGRLVREALNRAVNRQQIINVLFKGRGEPLYNTIFHSSLEGWNPRWEKEFGEKYGYDLEKAKKLLDQAGYPGVGGKNRFKMELWSVPFPGLPEVTEVSQSLVQSFNDIGIDSKLVDTELARAIDAFRDRHDAQFLLPLRQTARTITANMRIYYYTGPTDAKTGLPTAGGGALFIEDPLFDQVLDSLMTETDQAERDRLVRAAGDKVYDEYRTIPIVMVKATLVVNPKVVAEYHFGGTTPPFYFLEYAKAAR